MGQSRGKRASSFRFCISCCFSPTTSLMSLIATMRTSAKELGPMDKTNSSTGHEPNDHFITEASVEYLAQCSCKLKEFGITQTDCACAYPSAHDLIFRVLRCAGHLAFVWDALVPWVSHVKGPFLSSPTRAITLGSCRWICCRCNHFQTLVPAPDNATVKDESHLTQCLVAWPYCQ